MGGFTTFLVRDGTWRRACKHSFSNIETIPFLARKRVDLSHVSLYTIMFDKSGHNIYIEGSVKILLPWSSELATFRAVFSDWSALLRSRSKTSSGLLVPLDWTFVDFSFLTSSSSIDGWWDGNSIDFKMLREKTRSHIRINEISRLDRDQSSV